jgi:hypothetical protein
MVTVLQWTICWKSYSIQILNVHDFLMMNPLSVICNHICCIVTATRWRWLWRWGNLSIVFFGCCLVTPPLWLDSSDLQWTCFCISSNTSYKFKHYQLFVNSLTSTLF